MGFNNVQNFYFSSNMEEDYQTDDLLRACQMKGIAQVAFLDVSSAYSTTTLSDVSDDGIVDFLCENRAPLVGMPRVLRLQHPAVTAQLVVQIVEVSCQNFPAVWYSSVPTDL